TMKALVEERWRRFPEEERALSIQNLVRLRCVTFRLKPIDINSLFAQLPNVGVRNPFGTKWAAVDPHKLERVIKELTQRQLTASGLGDFPSERPGRLPEADFTLTALGRGLLHACQHETFGTVSSSDGMSDRTQ